MSRQEANFKILIKLQEFFAKHPEQRFHQGLWNLGIIERQACDPYAQQVPDENGCGWEILDKYYEEPDETLKKVEESFKKIEKDA